MSNQHELPNQHVTPSFTNAENIGFGYPFEQKVTVHNHLSIPVSVATRTGLKFTVPPQPCLFNPRFIVRLEITLKDHVRDDVISGLIETNFSNENPLFFIKSRISHDLTNVWHKSTIISLDFDILPEQLNDIGGSCYLHDVDLVISNLAFRDCPDHPHSEEGIKKQVTQAAITATGFNYAVDIVDNIGKYGERYIYVQNNVYRITPVKDTNRRDGIYITTKNPVDNTLSVDSYKTAHYALSMCDELGLHKTPEEAFSFGDNETSRKQQLLEQEHNLQLLKREQQAINLKHEQEIAAEKHHSALLEVQLKNESRRADVAATKLKDFYEEKSYRRKDESEGWKMLPTVMMGIGALFMGLKTLFSKS